MVHFETPCTSSMSKARFLAYAVTLGLLSGCANLIPQSARFADSAQVAIGELSARMGQSDDALRRALAAGWLLRSSDGKSLIFSTPFKTAWADASKDTARLLQIACAPLSLDSATTLHTTLMSAAASSTGVLAKTETETLGATLKAVRANAQAAFEFDEARLKESVAAARAACANSIVSESAAPDDIAMEADSIKGQAKGMSADLSEALNKLTTVLQIFERYQRSLALRRLALEMRDHPRMCAALAKCEKAGAFASKPASSLRAAVEAHARLAEPILLVEAHLAVGRAESGAPDAAQHAVTAVKRYQEGRAKAAAELAQKLMDAFDTYFKYADAYGAADSADLLDTLIKMLEDLNTLRGE
jgi:hypothetical protein